MKKYELVKTNTRQYLGEAVLYRIRYLIDLPGVKAGDLGGWIRHKKNLSQITGNAIVMDNAMVDCDARVAGNTRVDGDARVRGCAVVDGNAIVDDHARVTGDAVVNGNARVRGYGMVCGNARVAGDAIVDDNALIDGYAIVTCRARVTGNARVRGNARVGGIARIAGNVIVAGNARVRDDSICEKFNPINITSLTYNVTITDNNVHIGCKTFKLKQALKLASKWTSTKLNYEEAIEIEAEKKIIVEAIKYRLQQLREGEVC